MNTQPLADWKLERYVLGELPPADLRHIATQAAHDSVLQQRIQALRDSNRDLLETYPPAWMARQLKPMPRKTNRGLAWSRWLAPAMLATLALVMVPFYEFQDSQDGIRSKGLESQLEIWRQVGDSAEKLLPNTAVHAGDIVQLRYAVPEACYGVLLSVDGRGVVTFHLSDSDQTAQPLRPGMPIALDRSYQLDDAPRHETFYLIIGREDFDLAPITESVLQSVAGDSLHPMPQLQKGQVLKTFKLIKAP